MTLLDDRPPARVWVDACLLDDLVVDRGVAVLAGETQIALFRLAPGDRLCAIANVDPFSGAAVLSRGIVGSSGDVMTVASPMHKQRFDLRTGACLDDPLVCVASYPVRVEGGRVLIGLP